MSGDTASDDLLGVTALFISPHLDDAVFSSGGHIAKLVDDGERVLVMTCFTEPPDPEAATSAASDSIRKLHARWNIAEGDRNGVARFWRGRCEEDLAALAVLGARPPLFLSYRDAIYRSGQYYSTETVMGHVHAGDWELFEQLTAHVVANWRRTKRAVVYLPLGVAHVDHQLAFMTGAALRSAGADVWHYEDFPYVARERRALPLRLAELGAPYRSRIIEITREQLARWIEATARYVTQLEPTFGRIGPYQDVVTNYAAEIAGAPNCYAERVWQLDVGSVSQRAVS